MTLTLKAAARLRKEIVNGTITEGDDLTERALCERLEMSRSPIRMAMQILAGEGLLSYSEKRGYRLLEITPEHIRNAYEVRATLEGLACRLFSERGSSPELIESLHSELNVGRKIVSLFDGQFDDASWSEMNERFHNTIIDGASNPALAKALKQATGTPLAGLSSTVILRKQEKLELLKIAQDMHCRIVAALEQGEAQRAEALMREHVYQARDLIIEKLSSSEANGK